MTRKLIFCMHIALGNLFAVMYLKLVLKCSSTDASFIQDYFLMDEKPQQLQYLSSGASDLKWDEGFNSGAIAEGNVEDVGVVVSFEKYNDLFGFVTNNQLAGTILQRGSEVEALVLDVAKTEWLLHLSVKQEFINSYKERSSTSHSNKFHLD